MTATCEAMLNEFGQFHTPIDGSVCIFLHVRSRTQTRPDHSDSWLARLGDRVPQGDRTSHRPTSTVGTPAMHFMSCPVITGIRVF